MSIIGLPGNLFDLYLAGINYLNANNPEKGIESFQNLIDEYPDSPKVFNAKAKLILASAQ